MQVIAYATRYDGTAYPCGQLTEMHRLDREGFKSAYGGKEVSTEPKWSAPPVGFSMWRAGSGQLFAVSFGDGR